MKRDETGCRPVATRESNSDHEKACRLSIPPTSPTESGPKLHCPCIKVSFLFPQGWQHRMAGVIWWWEACGLDLCFPNLSCIRITWKFVRNLLASWCPPPEFLIQEGWGGAPEFESLTSSQVRLRWLLQLVGPHFENQWFSLLRQGIWSALSREAHLCRRRRLVNADHPGVSMPKGLSGYKTRTSKSTYHISQCRRRTGSDAHIASYQQFH